MIGGIKIISRYSLLASITITAILLLSTAPIVVSLHNDTDIDPLVNIELSLAITHIRAFDTIDRFSDPDFYVKIMVNDQEFTSPVWRNMNYVKEPDWSITVDVPDDEAWVKITIQLWDWNLGRDKLCDISNDYHTSDDQYDVELWYNLSTGHWYEDDYIASESVMFDPSGYGRLNGCDDNSIYQEDRDCELWFAIQQTDADGDGIPYWSELTLYGTNPEIDDTGSDYDGDGIPIEWEHKWGYDPMVWDDHANLDPDVDGLDNIEEYRTSQWSSDPFRQDIFLELDQMEEGPNGEGNLIPEGSKDMLWDAYAKHNIVFHIDDGCMGGGELLPFDENVSWDEIHEIYWEYFMHEDADHWRRGAFHYGLITYQCDVYHGFVFGSSVEGKPVYLDSFQVATKQKEELPFQYPLMRLYGRKSLNKEYHREIIYASAIMHETGHNLGIFHSNTPGCDNSSGSYPWQRNWWVWRNYRSVMNYGWMYTFVDYSDGSRGQNDFDDWNRIDLTFFQREIWWHR